MSSSSSLSSRLISKSRFGLTIPGASIYEDNKGCFTNSEYDTFQRFARVLGIDLSSNSVKLNSFGEVQYCISGVFRVSDTLYDIDWSNLNISSPLDLSAIPLSIRNLDLSMNQIPSVINLIPPGTFPPLEFLDLSHNSLTAWGSIPYLNLAGIDVSYNQIAESVQYLPFQSTLYKFMDFSNNQISAVSPSFFTYFTPNIQYVDLSNNKIDSPAPHFPSSLTFLNLSNNTFSGHLNLESASDLYIANNQISVISIANSSLLTTDNCDLSNNLFYLEDVSALNCVKNLLNKRTTTASSQLQSSLAKSSVSSDTRTSMTTTHYVTSQVSTSSTTVDKTKTITTIVDGTIKTTNQFSIKFTSGSTHIASTTSDLYSPITSNSLVLNPTLVFDEDSIISQDLNKTTHSTFSSIFVVDTNESNAATRLEPVDTMLIFYLIGALAVTIVLLLIASKLFKKPLTKSKYGRKNSFGTLNTVNTTHTK